jgi:sulfhydrogenase subunit beta (sulfur reductase)
MSKVIFESELNDLAKELAKKYRVFAPQIINEASHQGKWDFRPVVPESVLDFSYATTNTAPKVALFPPKDVLFDFSANNTAAPKTPLTYLFGISSEDLEGIDHLIKIFQQPIVDEPFELKAKNTIIVAIDRFSPPKNLKYDLYLQRVKPETYVAFAKTKTGKSLVNNKFFADIKITVPKVEKRPDPILENPLLAKIVAGSKDHPVWQELATICFGCGICSYVCPMCYCFETEDTISLPKEGAKPSGSRCRTWDSCMLKEFANTTHHNFRPELKDRIYNWYFHKFVRMPKEDGFMGCVDCNRCVIFCPAKINYRVTLARLIKDWEGGK